jgi:hypothetical protein
MNVCVGFKLTSRCQALAAKLRDSGLTAGELYRASRQELDERA